MLRVWILLFLLLAGGAQAAPRFTANFVEAEVNDVLRSLSDCLGRKLYLGPGVEGKVTIRFKDTPAEVALAQVVRAMGSDVAYKFVGDHILIVAVPGQATDAWISDNFLHPRPLPTRSAGRYYWSERRPPG